MREEVLSFVLSLTSHGGEQRLQFEAADPIIAQPPENRIATGHFRIEANMAERFAASDSVTDFVHNFFAADRWPTAARGAIAYVHAKDICHRSRMGLFMRSSGTVLPIYAVHRPPWAAGFSHRKIAAEYYMPFEAWLAAFLQDVPPRF